MYNAPKPKPQDVINDLKKLKGEFTSAAEDNQRKAASVTQALDLLEANEKKKLETEKNVYRDRTTRRATLVEGMLTGVKHKSEFAVFVDFTGSMTQKPFNAALDGASVLRPVKAGVALWGSADEPQWLKGDILDPAMREGLQKRGASSDFKPAVTEMIKTAVVNSLEGKKTHFVVVTDGEFADFPAAKKELEKLLGKNFKATIDFVIMGRMNTGFEFLSQELQKEFPSKVNHHVVSGPAYWQGTEADLSNAVQDTVAKIAGERLHPPAPKRKPKAAPQPG